MSLRRAFLFHVVWVCLLGLTAEGHRQPPWGLMEISKKTEMAISGQTVGPKSTLAAPGWRKMETIFSGSPAPSQKKW